jgi:uncharacterized DUF497 family protein
VILIAYTMRSGKVRILSARKANRNESTVYKAAFAKEIAQG